MPELNMYRTVLNTRPLLFEETRIVAQEMLAEKTKEETLEEIIDENLFQQRSEKRIISFYHEIWKRLENADAYYLTTIANGDRNQAKIVLFILILKQDRLFFEFMNEVWLDKFQRGDFQLTAFDIRSFFAQKTEQSEQVARWTEPTLKRLQTAYTSILYQVGFTIKKGLPTELVAPLLTPQLDEFVKMHENNHIATIVRGGIAP
ncbi:DUF1819 family protein [Salicibibacter kimchii]|uniref:DUF1819 family protein n=1 Tax=Salicibibacter kimchii TaxID=2099786 RepID=A0A345BXB8_9BACI|nr:DUF1819 family protein [Salicibibacter kimchii]AXF55599.1 DUF1819 family protein [Salicibibacter kimchii]